MSLAVHVVAPLGRDATMIVDMLRCNGLEAEHCEDVSQLAQILRCHAETPGEQPPCGALIIAEEALTPPVIQQLAEVVQQQPTWSDFPILILTSGGCSTLRSRQLESERASLGSPVLLERPIRTETLVSNVRAAVRSRERQYLVRDTLEERDRDLDDRKRAEAALVQSEKLAAVGRLAASISHEINNPLESVTNLLYLIRQEDHMPERAMTYLLLAERELARVSQIAGQTLRFQRQSTKPRQITPEELMESVVALYQGRLINANIQMVYEHRGAGAVTCYEGDIRQVLNNLVGNAIDSMRKGGKLILRTHKATLRRPQLHGGAPVPGIRITVADTGYGMSAETRAHLFEAFYTTKGIHGTGLGLWISHGIVEKHHGRLDVRSSNRPGRSGTVFSIFLPAALAPAA